MPSEIYAGSTSGPTSSRQATGTFTGTVYMDAISPRNETGIMTNHVTFLPGARTYWHTHEHGQILEVKCGSGWVCDQGGQPRRIKTGDMIVCGPGTTHWHGADDGSMMMHLAVSLGTTEWKEEVSADEYGKKGSG